MSLWYLLLSIKKASAPYILSGQNPIVRRTCVFSQVSRYSEIELFVVIRCYISTEAIELIRLASLLTASDRQWAVSNWTLNTWRYCQNLQIKSSGLQDCLLLRVPLRSRNLWTFWSIFSVNILTALDPTQSATMAHLTRDALYLYVPVYYKGQDEVHRRAVKGDRQTAKYVIRGLPCPFWVKQPQNPS